MKNVKRFIAVAMSIFILFLTAIDCLAAQKNVVYSDQITTGPNMTVDVPVYIAENTGLMGFAIEFEYDNTKVTPVSVRRGAMLTSGLFDDSIGTGSDNSFKVIWSNTSNIRTDGELFTVTFSVADVSEEEIVITMNASQKDTFNENWEKVSLTCRDITIRVSSNSSETGGTPMSFLKKIMELFKRIIAMIKSAFAFK